ncbi:MAG: sigma-70 family RNA polymerase sigma factor [Bacteroidales bacterium]
MINEKELVKRCLKNEPVAQDLLYRRYASKMLGVCLRYTKNRMEAEDILQEGYIKVFKYLGTYKFDGSLEGWIRRIMVNTAINLYKASIKCVQSLDDTEHGEKEIPNVIMTDVLSMNELLKIIQELPEGYRVIFNLYAIEGYSHKEISEMLNISESTSKSQLSRARVALQNKINKLNSVLYEETA